MTPKPMPEIAAVPVTPFDAVATSGLLEHASPAEARVAHEPLRAALPSGGQNVTTWQIAWGPIAVLCILLVALYERIGVKLVGDWYELPDFGHGFLIPFFAAFLVWDKREQLRRLPIAPTWAGMWLVVFGLFQLLVGVFGADLFLQRTSFIELAAGLVWTLLGRAMLGQVKFVLFVLVLAIPLPAVLFNQITFPLQLMSSYLASGLLRLAQVPVLQDGNIIQLPAIQLEVAEACSGIRSLMSLFTVAVIYGYFLERATWRRIVLALASIPIAVAANVVRIFGTGMCVQYWDPVKAMGFFHDFQGWLMFVVSLGLLYLVHAAMRALAPERSYPA
jgi:exosortase